MGADFGVPFSKHILGADKRERSGSSGILFFLVFVLIVYRARTRTRGARQNEDFLMRFPWPRAGSTERGHTHYIRLKLHDVHQLFNSMDPSPFIEKDLDADAEEFIVSWALEFPSDDPVRLHIYLEQWPAEDPKETIKTAVHNYFAHRAEIADLEFKRLMEQGRSSLFIGALFLSLCLGVSKLLLGREAGTWAAIARESLTIAGWVAMWRPMQIYLYDWWPLRRRERIYEKLSHMPVEVEQKGTKQAPVPPASKD